MSESLLWTPPPRPTYERLMVLERVPDFCPWCGANCAGEVGYLTSAPLKCAACSKNLYEYRHIEKRG